MTPGPVIGWIGQVDTMIAGIDQTAYQPVPIERGLDDNSFQLHTAPPFVRGLNWRLTAYNKSQTVLRLEGAF